MSAIKPFIVGIFLSALIIILFLLGVSNLIVINEGQSRLPFDAETDSMINNIVANISQGADDANIIYDATTNSSIVTTTDTPFIEAIGSIWKTAIRVPKVLYNLMIVFIVNNTMLSSEQAIIITSILGIILTITIIFGVYQLITTGRDNDK